jgi:rRNA processing protein Gar1
MKRMPNIGSVTDVLGMWDGKKLIMKRMSNIGSVTDVLGMWDGNMTMGLPY